MDWSNERYVRVYTRDTPEWALLSWEARGFFCLLLRAVDRAGALDMGKSGHKALASLLRMPLEAVSRLLPELLADGCIEQHGDRLLVPNYIDAQEARQSDKTRQQESRATRRDRIRAGLDPVQRATVIYFVQSEHGGPIKIGRAEDMAKRLLQLQTSRPDTLVVLAAAPGAVEDEAALHKRFAAVREKGEWFSPVPELMALVKDVAARGSIAFAVTGGDTSRDVTSHETNAVTPCRAVPCRAVPSVPDLAGASRPAGGQAPSRPEEHVLPAPTSGREDNRASDGEQAQLLDVPAEQPQKRERKRSRQEEIFHAFQEYRRARCEEEGVACHVEDDDVRKINSRFAQWKRIPKGDDGMRVLNRAFEAYLNNERFRSQGWPVWLFMTAGIYAEHVRLSQTEERAS